jgi:protease-4
MLTLHRYIILVLLFSLSDLTGAEGPEAKTTTGDPGGTLVVNLSGSLPLRPGGGMLFGDSGMSLYDATVLLKRAMTQVERRIVLDCSLEFDPGLTVAEELVAVLRSRSPDKRVICLIDNASDAVMALAAACDEVVMVEADILNVDGLSLSNDYYADALNRFGIKFHAVTSGAAKTAPEPFTSSRPSAAAIAEHQRLISALDQATLALGVRKNISLERLMAARAQAPQTAAIAKEYGLVDAAVEPGAWLKNQPGPVRYLRQETNKPDFNSLAGIMAFMNELMEGEQKKTRTRSVAVVELEGSIIEGDVSAPGYTIAGHDTAALFDRLINDTNIVGVVVRINSGGGSAGASDRAYYALKRLAAVKPVVALFDAVCASGGYYIGCAAKEIMVHRGTITGSIGVFAMIPDLEATRALFGVNRHTISTGPRAEVFSTSSFTADKEAAIRQVVVAVDERFQSIVAENRRLALDKVHELAGGRVFSGDEAVALGLADRLGDLPAAVARVRELAGINEALPLERLPYASGLAARLGLGGVQGVQSAMLEVAIPPVIRVMVEQVQRSRLQVMAWTSPLTVE